MLIDTHAHLNIEPLLSDWQEILHEANKAGIDGVIVPGANIETSRNGVKIASKSKNVWAAVGIHPEEVQKIEFEINNWEAEIRELARQPSVVAIGEIGLDYFRLDDNQIVAKQKKLFRLQMNIARDNKLPLIIHSRTKQALIDTLEEINITYGTHQFKGVFHCFDHDKTAMHQIIELGGYIGVGGRITYQNNQELMEVIGQTPLNRILLETDAPWLAPVPRLTKTNYPANVTITALKLAKLLNLPLSQVLEQTTANAKKLFLLEI